MGINSIALSWAWLRMLVRRRMTFPPAVAVAAKARIVALFCAPAAA